MRFLNQSIIAFLMVTAASIAAVLLFTTWRANRHMAGVRWFAGAGATGAVGFFLATLPVPHTDGPDWPMLINGGFVFTALLMVLEGSLRFMHRESHLRWRAGLVLVPVFVLLNWWYEDEMLAQRIFHDAAYSVVVLVAAFTMLRSVKGDDRMINSLVAFFLMGIAGAMAARSLVAGQVETLEALQQHPVHALTLAVVVLCIMGWTYSVHMACYVRSQASLRMMLHKDPVTGLSGRQRMADFVQREIARCERSGVRFSYLIVELHEFQQAGGHADSALADEVLLAFGQRLDDYARGADFACPLGDDQFGVILHHTPSQEHLRGAVARLRHLLAQPLEVRHLPTQVDISLGMAMWPTDGQTLEALESIATQRMQAEKFSMFKPYVQSEGLRTG
ncbi:MAG: diguanylate cyclase [Curvibacter sp.]|nr:MAG: diguanylate cyclase [Curvibacter sp.]